MRIIHIMPGYVENYYCENCVRDNHVVQVLRELGHDVIIVPLYMPTKLEGAINQQQNEIFYGGLNTYLQQKYSFFRKTPRWVDKMLDSPKLLRWITRFESRTRAKDLAQLALSTLKGEQGQQVKELNRLVDWLSQHHDADLVTISNAILVGLAPKIRSALNIPVICMLQDEHDYLDAFPEPYKSQTWQVAVNKARSVNGFIAFSHYYTDVMRQRLELAENQLHTIRPGLPTMEHQNASKNQDDLTIGFLSRACYYKGFDLLIDAFLRLKKEPQFKALKLKVCGDRFLQAANYNKSYKQRLKEAAVENDVEYIVDFSTESRQAFLNSITVLSVPETTGESYGLYALEAMAQGVPIVQPDNGVFPEMIQLTKGGLLFETNNTDSLHDALKSVLSDKSKAETLSTNGQKAIKEYYDLQTMGKQLEQIYQQVISSHKDSTMAHNNALIHLSQISKQYEAPGAGENPQVLTNVNLTVQKGESLAIIGPSGSGKSTLLNILGALDHPTSGQIQFDGQDMGMLDQKNQASIRNSDIGFVFQMHHLLPQCTVMENVLLPTLVNQQSRPECQQRANELLERVGLSHRLDHRPGELSGGERQRVAFVRALINQPKLLLADEPTGSLDEATSESLIQLLMELNKEQHIAMIIVTHSNELAHKLDKVYRLEHGQLHQEK